MFWLWPFVFCWVRRLRGLLPGGRYCFQCDGRRRVPRGGKRRDHLLPALPRGGAFPSLADVILALGCETQLAGASEGCTQSALDELEKVSADSVEAIQALQPDLVLVDSNSSGAQSALEEAGVTVLSVEPCHRPLRLRAAVFPGFLGAAGGRGRL